MEQEALNLDPRLIVAGIATIISAASLSIAIYSGWKTRLATKVSVAIARFNAAESQREHIRTWAGRSLDILGDALTQLNHSNDQAGWPTKKVQLLSRLTSEIDKGRWLFPNFEHERYGANKEGAYSGLRQPPLDFLTFAYDSIYSIDTLESETTCQTASSILKNKREFVSAIQDKLEPRNVEAELLELSRTIT